MLSSSPGMPPIPCAPEEASEAHGVAFSHLPVSPEAVAFRETLIRMIEAREVEQGRRQRARSSAMRKDLEEAIGRFAIDLLRSVDPEARRRLSCPKDRSAFTGLPVGYNSFKAAYEAFRELGLLDQVKAGGWSRLGPDGDPKWRVGRGQRERIRVTQRFVDLMREHGIEPGTWRDHAALDRATPPPPIEVRASNIQQEGRRKVRRRSPVTADDAPAGMRDAIEELNGFLLRETTIEGTEFTGFTRIFNESDHPDFAWNRGGRLYANPRQGSYQSLSKEERLALRINGEPVVEIDLVASQITIAHGLHGEEMFEMKDSPVDPYAIDGLPRPVVKAFVTATLGKGKPLRRWSSEHREDFVEQGIDPQQFPIGPVSELVLARLPILGRLDGIDWANLQFVESEILIATMLTLKRDHGVPSLPVHDSLIVPLSGRQYAMPQLGADFLARVRHWFAGILCNPPLKPGDSLAP